MDKSIRKETLRKLLKINTDYFKSQNNKIDSLTGQLEIMIKERNKYKAKANIKDSLEYELKKVTKEKNKLAKAYAKQLKIIQSKGSIRGGKDE